MARVPLGFFKRKEEPKVIIEKHTTERVVERQIPVAAPSDHLIERINDSVGFINKDKIAGMAAIERNIVDLWNGITAAQRMVSRGFAGSTPAPSSGGAGTPASTVTSETSYGIASAVGTSTNYAREDHTHGTPATPTKTTVGLANVDNTADASKPVSTAQQTALDLKANLSGVAALSSTVSLTNQGADISDTAFSVSTVGLYRIEFYMLDTTADLSAGAVTLNIKFTDDAAARTISSQPVVLSATSGFSQGEVVARLASGSITYGVTHSGIFGNAKYALYLTQEKLI